MNTSLFHTLNLRCTAGLLAALALSSLAFAEPSSPDASLPPLTGGTGASADSPSGPFACLIEPFQVSEVGSPSAGVLARVLVQRGDTVKQGQVVAELNTSVDVATLELRRAESAYLDRVVNRNEDLFKRNLLPANDYDEIVSRSRQAQLQVALQQAVLAERSIRSPFDGVVAERYAGPGDRINDNKIVKLAQIDPLLVKVVLPDSVYGQIKSGANASVSVNPAISKKPLRATVWRIDRVMDAASGTFTVLLKVDNKNNAIPAGIRCSIGF